MCLGLSSHPPKSQGALVPAGVAAASLPQVGPSASSAKVFDAGATNAAAGKLNLPSQSAKAS